MQTQDADKTKLQKITDKCYWKPQKITEEKDKIDRNRRKFKITLTWVLYSSVSLKTIS